MGDSKLREVQTGKRDRNGVVININDVVIIEEATSLKFYVVKKLLSHDALACEEVNNEAVKVTLDASKTFLYKRYIDDKYTIK